MVTIRVCDDRHLSTHTEICHGIQPCTHPHVPARDWLCTNCGPEQVPSLGAPKRLVVHKLAESQRLNRATSVPHVEGVKLLLPLLGNKYIYMYSQWHYKMRLQARNRLRHPKTQTSFQSKHMPFMSVPNVLATTVESRKTTNSGFVSETVHGQF